MYLILVIKCDRSACPTRLWDDAVLFLQATKELANFGQGTALFGPQVPYL